MTILDGKADVVGDCIERHRLIDSILAHMAHLELHEATDPLTQNDTRIDFDIAVPADVGTRSRSSSRMATTTSLSETWSEASGPTSAAPSA